MPIATLIALSVLANCLAATAAICGIGAFVSMPLSYREEPHVQRARKRSWILFTIAGVAAVITIALHTFLGFYK